MSEQKPLLPGMVHCEVEEDRMGCITVTIPGHPGELFFQSDYDQASFACHCGHLGDSDPALLVEIDLEDITQCPDEYINHLRIAGEEE